MVKEFTAGKIFNPVQGRLKKPFLRYSHIKLNVPARINNMVFDTKTLTTNIDKKRYYAGEFVFSVNANTYANLKIGPNKKHKILISKKCKRPSLVIHAARMMQKILRVSDSWWIESNNQFHYPHAGLGSSSSIISAVCIAINEAYNKPLNERQLVLLISQNHGEEIKNEKMRLIHVQCNGASPSVALYKGGMQVVCGEADLILREDIPKDHVFIFGIPKSYKKYDAKSLMSMEEKITFSEMKRRSKDYSNQIAWKVLHQLLPAIIHKDMKSIGDVLEYYRFETGSLESDVHIWPELKKIMQKLRKKRDKDTEIVSTSSCGPLVYALTVNEKKIMRLFKNLNMKTFKVTPNNCGYTVLKFE